jgi:hypothetical protein
VHRHGSALAGQPSRSSQVVDRVPHYSRRARDGAPPERVSVLEERASIAGRAVRLRG